MDCYLGHDELVFMEDHGQLDRLPSPGSWSTWGTGAPENFGFPNKYFATYPVGDQGFRNAGNDEGMKGSVHDKDQCSSSICGGPYEELSQQTALSSDFPDWQLDDLTGIRYTDDIFLNSLLREDMPTTSDLHNLSQISSGFHSAIMQNETSSSNVALDSRSISSDGCSTESGTYLKDHALAPSVGNAAASKFTPCNGRQMEYKPAQATLVNNNMVSSGGSIPDGHVVTETSEEESALQELGMAMAQLTEKTRICFRDSLYRLAKNSKRDTETEHRSGNLLVETQSERKRPVRKEAAESGTNTIDRAVADLMFNKMDFHTQDLPLTTSVNSKEEVTEPCNQKPKISNNGYWSNDQIFSEYDDVHFADDGAPANNILHHYLPKCCEHQDLMA